MDVRNELLAEIDRVFLSCPDEIKRFHYGLIQRDEKDTDAFNEYFSLWVHVYAGYAGYQADIPAIISLASDPEVNTKTVKEAFNALVMSSSPFLGQFAGQELQAKYSKMVMEVLDSAEKREEVIELLTTYHMLISRLYWWFHWYFPWGLGTAGYQIRSVADLRELARLELNSNLC